MKGLELSKALFEQYMMPMIQKELPEVIPFLAAGLVGEGSECFGFDDEISLDHDGQVRLCIWLGKEAFQKYENPLRSLFAKLPKEILGREVEALQTRRSGVFETGSFYEMLIGSKDCPVTNKQWMETDETLLAAAVNGEVFLDNDGEFTGIRNRLLAFYPQDVFLLKLAKAIAVAAQAGQYNYPRAVKRNDPVTADMIRMIFIDYCTRAVFLLNRTYRPFYKWTYQALLDLPVLGKELHEKTGELLQTPWDRSEEMIENISQDLIALMKEQSLTENGSDFMMDHIADLLTKIQDQTLLKKGLSLTI